VNSLEAYWVASLRLDSTISGRPCGFACSPYPDLFGSGVILPRAFRPLQRSLPTACLPRLPGFRLSTSTRFARKRLPWGFRPLRDFSRSSSDVGSHSPVRILPRVTPVGTRPLGRSVLGVSHALDGFLRYRPCGLVSSRCRVQDSVLQGFFPHLEPFRLSPAACPPVVPPSPLRFDPRQFDGCRLQGFSPQLNAVARRDW